MIYHFPLFRGLAAAALLSVSLITFSGCGEDDEPVTPAPDVAGAKIAAVNTYAEIVLATYDDAVIAAQTLDTKARAFVAAPTAGGLDELRAAWKAARVPYNQTDAFRFYGGPIDNASSGVESLLNAWPMEESFIDYTTGNAASGLINNPTALPVVDKSSVAALNQYGGETNISCGYHAVEFLLWGQDLSATGPGARPYTDYTTAPNATRRGQYLVACTSLIVEHLENVRAAWTPGYAYLTNFVSIQPTDSALVMIMSGLGRLSKGELAGERMQVALDNQDQEDEHSCFSDNTDQDLKGNEQGIVNVITGTYTRTNGTRIQGVSLADAVKTANPTTGASLLTAATQAKTAVDAIRAPFDQEIIGADGAPGRQRVRAAVTSCRAQADQVAAAARSLGITLVL